MKDFIEEYQKLFDSFVQTRKLDLDDEYWSDKDKKDFLDLYNKLLANHSKTKKQS